MQNIQFTTIVEESVEDLKRKYGSSCWMLFWQFFSFKNILVYDIA